MDKENSFNWKIRIATLSIFLLGFVAGALALNAYHVWFSAASSNTRQHRFEKMLEPVQLSDQQKTDVQKIMGETREEFKNLPPNPQMQEIRNRADEKLKKVFTTEQWDRFQQIRNEERNKQQ